MTPSRYHGEQHGLLRPRAANLLVDWGIGDIFVKVLDERRRLGVTGNPDYDGTPFTGFASVTPATPLECLNLNWRERDLPERERTKHVHRLHPYLGKFVPQLVEIFLRKYRPEVACDPFCGSGTTLVEALALGIDSVGCDVSPFNCLLSGVKIGEYDLSVLRQEVEEILRCAQDDRGKAQDGRGKAQDDGGKAQDDGGRAQDDRGGSLEDSPGAYLQEWFAPPALRQLLAYRSLIPEYRYGDVLKVIVSRAARSARLTAHFDLDYPKAPVRAPYYCHKHERICRPTEEALGFLRRYSRDTLRRLETFARLRRPARATVIQGDAREVQFPPSDLVVTSPPYVGLIDYHAQHRYAYELLGLPGNQEAEIGASWRGSSTKAVQRYVDDMTDAFASAGRSLCRGGRMVVVVHDRRNLYDGIARRLGLTTEHRLRRHVNRRTGRRAGDFFEDVLVWRK